MTLRPPVIKGNIFLTSSNVVFDFCIINHFLYEMQGLKKCNPSPDLLISVLTMNSVRHAAPRSR